jgi:acyl carrier protein
MTLEELRSAIAEILEIDVSEVHDDASPETIEQWDSMVALGIISLFDDVYEGEITAEDAQTFTSFKAIADFARAKGFLTT